MRVPALVLYASLFTFSRLVSRLVWLGWRGRPVLGVGFGCGLWSFTYEVLVFD